MIALVHDGLDVVLAVGWITTAYRKGRQTAKIRKLCKQVASSTSSAEVPEDSYVPWVRNDSRGSGTYSLWRKEKS